MSQLAPHERVPHERVQITSMLQSNPSCRLTHEPGCKMDLAAVMNLRSTCRWVEEYHVDGFRFDLAACLCRDVHGEPLSAPPVIQEISKDPVLSKARPLLLHALPGLCTHSAREGGEA